MVSPTRNHAARVCALLALAVAFAFGVADPARGAVAYRNHTCKSQTLIIIGSFSMSRPAGVVAGDVMIATMRSSSFIAFNFSTPSGWTEIAGATDDNAKLFYKVAGGSEPGSYTFASILGVTATMVGSIVAFSGVDNATPISASSKTTGSGTNVAIPSLSTSRNGSTYYANVSSGATTTSTFSAPLTETCDQSGGGVTIANAYTPTGAGTVTGLTDSLSSSTSWVAQALMLQPSSPCTTGGLTLTPPGSISFGSTALDGTNRTATAGASFAVSDMTDTAAGWNLTATSTTFTSGGDTLPTSATTFTGLTITAGATNCGMPATSSTSFPITMPAGTVAPPATKIYSNSVGNGLGQANLAYTLALAIPANTHIGTYTSTWTFTLASGP